jgi:hypothetical protein
MGRKPPLTADKFPGLNAAGTTQDVFRDGIVVTEPLPIVPQVGKFGVAVLFVFIHLGLGLKADFADDLEIWVMRHVLPNPPLEAGRFPDFEVFATAEHVDDVRARLIDLLLGPKEADNVDGNGGAEHQRKDNHNRDSERRVKGVSDYDYHQQLQSQSHEIRALATTGRKPHQGRSLGHGMGF